MGLNITFLHTDSERWALGIRILSAVLKNAGHHTRIITMGGEERLCSQNTLNEIKELVQESAFIGLSCFSRSFEKAAQIAKFLRPLNKIIVWGGMHATLNPEKCLTYADIICRGEGEGFMLELLNKYEKGKEWKNIENAVYKINGIIVLNNLRSPVKNLDDLPLIDCLNTDEFHFNGKKFVKIPLITDSRTPIMFSGSRGCNFFCNYCSNAKIKQMYEGTGNYVRKMSIGKFISYTKKLKDIFPKAKYFYFVDEDFFARSLDEFKEFAEKYPKLIGLPFECMGSPPQITEEKMELLVKAGLWRIDVGMESGSERTKKHVFNRHMSNSTVMRSAEIINKFPQVISYYFFIIGNPFETKDDLIQTAVFIKALPSPFFLRTYNLVFFPGSNLFEMAVKDGIIDGIKDSGYEIDFLAGYDYKGHQWKEKNIYLNGLLFLMSGTISKHFLGLIPRFLITKLLNPVLINFNEKYTFIIKLLIKIKGIQLKLRRETGNIANKIFDNPIIIYKLRFLGRRSFKKVTNFLAIFEKNKSLDTKLLKF